MAGCRRSRLSPVRFGTTGRQARPRWEGSCRTERQRTPRQGQPAAGSAPMVRARRYILPSQSALGLAWKDVRQETILDKTWHNSSTSDGTPSLILIFIFGRPPGTSSVMQGIELNSIALRHALTAALVAPCPFLSKLSELDHEDSRYVFIFNGRQLTGHHVDHSRSLIPRTRPSQSEVVIIIVQWSFSL